MEKSELRKLVRKALDLLRPIKRNDLFTLQEIADTIQNESGQQLHSSALNDIRKIMMSLWGSGVEPVGVGAETMNSVPWKFGYGKRPVSREIRPR
jgi:hypothetical protein